jgi:hypothetical protein
MSFLFLAKAGMPATAKTSAKKTASKTSMERPASDKNEIKIKYADKSPGQPQLTPIFEEIKNLLTPYGTGTMKLIGGTEGKIVLISKKPVEIFGRKRDELWFASALVQKGYVGFYFMPVYGDEGVKKLIRPELLKCLKGKACFHIKKFDEKIFLQIKEALKTGYASWQKRGWI